ncbi:MAG: hypothetical protein J0H74_15155 [Chitinophagaceae bacterium]|nr:hypothetical protein [Chitinophagaceae bacterium]
MKIPYLFLLTLLCAASCKTYYMTPASLKQQLDNINPEKINEAYDFRLGLTGILLKGGKNFYNGIDTISVTEKNGKETKLPVTTRMGVRLTDTAGHSVIVYFDSMFTKDSLVFASKSHFLTLPIHRNIYSLSKVEVQK